MNRPVEFDNVYLYYKSLIISILMTCGYVALRSLFLFCFSYKGLYLSLHEQ